MRLGLPLTLRRRLHTGLLNTFVGRPEQFGFPKSEHRLLETHPIINSHIYMLAGQGDIVPKPDIDQLQGNTILFKDATAEAIDVIVWATGYHLERLAGWNCHFSKCSSSTFRRRPGVRDRRLR